MSFAIEFVTDVPFEIDRNRTSAIAEALQSSAPETQRGTVNVAFVDDETMRAYNRDYRGIDKTTDVLSFHYFDDFSECSPDEVAGEILLSESRIREQAPEYGNTAEEETYKLLVHSLAHLLGYDHETDEEYEKMRTVEEGVEKFLKDSYPTHIPSPKL